MTGKQQEEVIDIVVDKNQGLSKSEITEESRLFLDLDLDDLDHVEILMELEKHFGIVIPDDAWFKTDTIGDIFKLLDGLL